MAGSYKRTVGGVSERSSYLRIGEAGAGPPFKEWLKRNNRSLPSMPLQPKAAITRGPALSYLDFQGLDGFGARGHYSLGTAKMCFHRRGRSPDTLQIGAIQTANKTKKIIMTNQSE